MYCMLFVLLMAVTAAVILLHYRRKTMIALISHLPPERKIALLNKLSTHFGFAYAPHSDVFIMENDDTVSKETTFFPQVTCDTKSVCPDRHEKTWCLNIQKGQHGIHSGCEIQLDRRPPALSLTKPTVQQKEEGKADVFLEMSVRLYCKGALLAKASSVHRHFVLFIPGTSLPPEELSVSVKLLFSGFPSSSMPSQKKVLLHFHGGMIPPRRPKRFVRRYVLWRNRQLSRLYHLITHPFCSTPDRLLFLYFSMPAVCRSVFFMKLRGR